MDARRPPPIAPGALVAVVAPSSPFDRDELFRGLAWLRQRYRLRIATSIFARAGYLAGDDARRAAELGRAMTDAEVGAILCARGGYGAMRILDSLPWDAFAAAPKWIIGFSDVTALHAAAQARNVCTIHGPNATGLGRSITSIERYTLIKVVEGSGSGPAWEGLDVLRPGSAEGPLVGGNLALVHAMAAAGRFVVPPGAVVVLEDVTERPYRIDRMLASLHLAGVFARAAAVVFGSFTQCEAGSDGVAAREVLLDLARRLAIPVLANAPFGHGAPNHAFVLGARARVDGDRLSFSVTSSSSKTDA
ncbi:MAG TPA: LD-carboxypeptidase [Labilithrix sp.]|jgi:muramoyltetrapeptide carboxypeptidase